MAEVMSTYSRPWCLCGGWAVDAWLGRETREHRDFDVTLFADDYQEFFNHLSGWNMVAHCGPDPGVVTEPWDGRALDLPAHLHARPPGAENHERLLRWVTPPFEGEKDGLDIEFVINEAEDGEWLLNREPRISLPLDRCWRDSEAGMPTAAPGVILFYKATAYHDDPRFQGRRPYDESDFFALLPLVGQAERRWLAESIEAARPGHPWLERIGL